MLVDEPLANGYIVREMSRYDVIMLFIAVLVLGSFVHSIIRSYFVTSRSASRKDILESQVGGVDIRLQLSCLLITQLLGSFHLVQRY